MMDFDWLEARRAGGRVDRAAWRQMLCEKAALLARLQYSRQQIQNRCHQELVWMFGEDKKRWPVPAKIVKEIVVDALDVARRGP